MMRGGNSAQYSAGFVTGFVGFRLRNRIKDYTCIVIRSALVENGIATVQAGAGVISDSVVREER